MTNAIGSLLVTGLLTVAASTHHTFTGSNNAVYLSSYDLTISSNAVSVRIVTETNYEYKVEGFDPLPAPVSENGVTLAMFSCTPRYSKTERDEIITTIEVKTLTFKWEGQEHKVEHRKELSRSVKKWKKREEWEVEK